MASEQLPPNRYVLLHKAVAENNEKAVKFLLKHGVDANARLTSSKDSLQRITGDNVIISNDIFEIFSRYRTSSITSCTFSPNPITITDCNFYTFNASGGYRKRSFSNISEIYKQPVNKSPTPLHVAAANGKREIVELLVVYGADVNARMEGDYTPLVIAILSKHYEIAQLLVNQGAFININVKNGKTPMHFAVKSKMIEMVQLLISNGGNVNARTDHGITPLHIAVERKLQDVTELLLKNGSDVNASTKTGVTPLHCAAVKGHQEITEMILNYGADVSVIMKKGEIDVTPLLWVTESERRKITEILKKYAIKTHPGGFYGRFFKKIWKRITKKSETKN